MLFWRQEMLRTLYLRSAPCWRRRWHEECHSAEVDRGETGQRSGCLVRSSRRTGFSWQHTFDSIGCITVNNREFEDNRLRCSGKFQLQLRSPDSVELSVEHPNSLRTFL